MNTALILAGGVGHRMNQEIPKQFLNVNNKPLIMYTLEAVSYTHLDHEYAAIPCCCAKSLSVFDIYIYQYLVGNSTQSRCV